MIKTKLNQGVKRVDFYQKMSHELNYDEIQQMTRAAMDRDNVEAMLGLAQTNQYAVSSTLSSDKGAKFLQKKTNDEVVYSLFPQLFFMLRNAAPLKYKIIFRQLARRAILRTSLRISGKGIRGDVRRRVRYRPGMLEFDLDQSLQVYFEKKFLTYWDIVGIERRKKKKVGVVMIDTSGSMYGRLLLNAALTAAVLSYHMAKTDPYSIVVFNSKALALKSLNEYRDVDDIVNDILDSEAVGFTNIEAALLKGLEELAKNRFENRFGILISDGEYNRGEDPVYLASKFRQLHVINIPSEKPTTSKGLEKCAEIAHAGRGSLVKVHDYTEIPRALMRLLQKL